LIRRRFGAVEESLKGRLDELSSEQLDQLGEALFDFMTAAELEDWIDQQTR